MPIGPVVEGNSVVATTTNVVVVVNRQNGGALFSLTDSRGCACGKPRGLPFPLTEGSWHTVTFHPWTLIFFVRLLYRIHICDPLA